MRIGTFLEIGWAGQKKRTSGFFVYFGIIRYPLYWGEGGGGKSARREKNGKRGGVLKGGGKVEDGAVRRSLQTGRTSFRVSLSQTNGLRLFDAVFHQNLLFIIPRHG